MWGDESCRSCPGQGASCDSAAAQLSQLGGHTTNPPLFPPQACRTGLASTSLASTLIKQPTVPSEHVWRASSSPPRIPGVRLVSPADPFPNGDLTSPLLSEQNCSPSALDRLHSQPGLALLPSPGSPHLRPRASPLPILHRDQSTEGLTSTAAGTHSRPGKGNPDKEPFQLVGPGWRSRGGSPKEPSRPRQDFSLAWQSTAACSPEAFPQTASTSAVAPVQRRPQ